jgi:hypothetical protein
MSAIVKEYTAGQHPKRIIINLAQQPISEALDRQILNREPAHYGQLIKIQQEIEILGNEWLANPKA